MDDLPVTFCSLAGLAAQLRQDEHDVSTGYQDFTGFTGYF